MVPLGSSSPPLATLLTSERLVQTQRGFSGPQCGCRGQESQNRDEDRAWWCSPVVLKKGRGSEVQGHLLLYSKFENSLKKYERLLKEWGNPRADRETKWGGGVWDRAPAAKAGGQLRLLLQKTGPRKENV